MRIARHVVRNEGDFANCGSVRSPPPKAAASVASAFAPPPTLRIFVSRTLTAHFSASVGVASRNWPRQHWQMVGKSRASIASALIAALLASPSTAQVSERVWQPAGDWSIEQGDHCVAVLLFTQKSAQLKFAIEPDPTKPVDLVYFITEGDAEYPYGWTTADIAVGRKWKFDQGIQITPSEQPQHVVYRWGISDEGLNEVQAAGGIQVSGKALRLELQLPGLSSARARLQACNSALLTRWGFGPEQQARIAHFPTIEKLNIKDSDYPVAAAKRSSIGNVGGYLIVGVDGRASDCHVLNSSRWPALDSQSCHLLLQRVHYKPAVDKTGKAMAAPYHFEFAWSGSSPPR